MVCESSKKLLPQLPDEIEDKIKGLYRDWLRMQHKRIHWCDLHLELCGYALTVAAIRHLTTVLMLFSDAREAMRSDDLDLEEDDDRVRCVGPMTSFIMMLLNDVYAAPYKHIRHMLPLLKYSYDQWVQPAQRPGRIHHIKAQRYLKSVQLMHQYDDPVCLFYVPTP